MLSDYCPSETEQFETSKRHRSNTCKLHQLEVPKKFDWYDHHLFLRNKLKTLANLKQNTLT